MCRAAAPGWQAGGMGKVYDGIDDKLAGWLTAQPMFFVATAPLSSDGHVNLSPKGMTGSFAVLGPHRVAYLDYFGSGAETIAHLRENGRIVLMFCAFSGKPQIVRLHGRGRVLLPDSAAFAELRPLLAKDRDHGLRSIIDVSVDRVSDSCGYAVPNLEYVADREVLDLSHAKRDADYFVEYAATRNATSIDGLPALS
jgi:hypothetical protein